MYHGQQTRIAWWSLLSQEWVIQEMFVYEKQASNCFVAMDTLSIATYVHLPPMFLFLCPFIAAVPPALWQAVKAFIFPEYIPHMVF